MPLKEVAADEPVECFYVVPMSGMREGNTFETESRIVPNSKFANP